MTQTKHTKRTKSYNKTRRRHHGGSSSFKRANCSPLVNNKRNKPVNKNSCFTEYVLNVVKNEYNKDHRDDPIVSNNNDEVWRELKRRLSSCDEEKCWLNEIDNKALRKDIEQLIFAPESPPEWKQKPDEWLSNFDILGVLKQYEQAYPRFKFIGPTAIDFDSRLSKGNCVSNELCEFSLKQLLDDNKSKLGVVFNLDKHNQSGSHWVSLFLDLDNRFLFYFDSAANDMPNEIKKLIKRILSQGEELKIHIDDITQAVKKQHQYGNTECGMYALYFITTLLTEETGDGKKLHSNQDKIDYFTKKRIPDQYVFHYRKKFFNGGGNSQGQDNSKGGRKPMPTNNTTTVTAVYDYSVGKPYPPEITVVLDKKGTIGDNARGVEGSIQRIIDYAEYENRVKERERLKGEIKKEKEKKDKNPVKLKKLEKELENNPEIKLEDTNVNKSEIVKEFIPISHK